MGILRNTCYFLLTLVMAARDFYSILNVSRDADAAEIKRAYRA